MAKSNIKIKSSLHQRFKLTTIELGIDDLPSELVGYHFLQISDPHFGIYTSRALIEKAISITNEISPDMIFLTGDYVHVGRQEVKTMLYKVLGPSLSRYSQYRRLARSAAKDFGEILSTLKAPDGIIGIWGNHDYLEGKRTIARYLPDSIRWLKNESVDLTIRGHQIRISGIDDYRFGEPDIEQTVHTDEEDTSLPDDNSKVRIFLSHNPDTILLPKKELLAPYHIMLCGHTHGGQICLPGSIPLKTETKQKKVLNGLCNLKEMPIYVSNGVGCSGIPLRLFCPPELVSIRLTTLS
jgi:uncharacterized protein